MEKTTERMVVGGLFARGNALGSAGGVKDTVVLVERRRTPMLVQWASTDTPLDG